MTNPGYTTVHKHLGLPLARKDHDSLDDAHEYARRVLRTGSCMQVQVLRRASSGRLEVDHEITLAEAYV